MSRPVRIRAVTPREGFKVHLEFTDNTTKEIDLEPYLHGPIFEPIRRDPCVFRSVKVDPQMGTVVWENGAERFISGAYPCLDGRAIRTE